MYQLLCQHSDKSMDSITKVQITSKKPHKTYFLSAHVDIVIHSSSVKNMYLLKPLQFRQNVTQGQFLNRIQQVWSKRFPSPVAMLRIKDVVYIILCLSKEEHKLKNKLPHSGFELGLQNLFSMMMTVMSSAPPSFKNLGFFKNLF